ncbi:uncharacterized protein LOC126679400 [Mercurialis annua]|uniref:uncharacterized protein LOC126679400 n=1 Tax=Mercurialis annua TaxID=3986 RepID=UPI00215EB271|nr:uncharacterized protein LOC126679400 [Mercurialis annua]
MNESEEHFGQSLSLIDVSFEDDCLYNSPSQDPQFSEYGHNTVYADDPTEHKTVLGIHTSADSLRGDEQGTQPLEKENTRKNEKYNLRKSLAWDTAFFTNAGVLEPDELSNIIQGAERSERKPMLPGIEEDVHRSTDSISTLATDCSTLTTLEDDLFGDIRASIQKSCKASNIAVSETKLGSGVDKVKLSKPSGKVKILPQNKLKTKDALKKPNVTVKGPGKMVNQAPPSAQTSKSALGNGEATSSLCKPPKIVGRPSAITAAAAKRDSLGLGANRVKSEKDNAKSSIAHSVPARGGKIPAIGGSRNIVPKPMQPVRSSPRPSVVTKNQLTSSSIDSLESLSSNGSCNNSLNIVKRNIGPRTSSTGSIVKTTLRAASRIKNQPISARNAPHLKSVSKLSSNISPASSWSSESLSPTSTLNKMSNSSRPIPSSGNPPKVLDSKKHSHEKFSVGHGTKATGLPSDCTTTVSTGSGPLVCPDSVKPSGLRMPSAKIGFFDGGKSATRTPNGNRQSLPTVSTDLPRFDPANVSPSGGLNKTKPGKIQPARTIIVRGTKIGTQQSTTEIQPISSLPLQESSNAALNVSTASRNGKHLSGVIPSRKSPNLKAEKIRNVEMNDSLSKDEMSPQSKDTAPVNDSELIPNNEGSGTTCNSSSISKVENIMLPQQVGEDAICGERKDLHFIFDVEKGKTFIDDQVDCLAQRLAALDLHREVQPKPINECLSVDRLNESAEVNAGTIHEFVKSSIPDPSSQQLKA